MKKVLMTLAALVFSASAFAQVPVQGRLDNMVAFGGVAVDISHARQVDLTNNNQKITDAQGNVITGYFLNLTAFGYSPAFKNYLNVYAGSQIYWNMSMISRVPCINSQSVIYWNNGAAQNLNDGCSLASAALSWSRSN